MGVFDLAIMNVKGNLRMSATAIGEVDKGKRDRLEALTKKMKEAFGDGLLEILEDIELNKEEGPGYWIVLEEIK